MEYSKEIVSRLLDVYERRNGFARDLKELRSIQLDIAKEYPAYNDRYDNEIYEDINFAIEKGIASGYICADKNQSGRYTKIRLNVLNVAGAYARSLVGLIYNSHSCLLDLYVYSITHKDIYCNKKCLKSLIFSGFLAFLYGRKLFM